MAKATTGFTLTAVVVVNFLQSFFFWSRRQTKLRISDRVTAGWGRQPTALETSGWNWRWRLDSGVIDRGPQHLSRVQAHGNRTGVSTVIVFRTTSTVIFEDRMGIFQGNNPTVQHPPLPGNVCK